MTKDYEDHKTEQAAEGTRQYDPTDARSALNRGVEEGQKYDPYVEAHAPWPQGGINEPRRVPTVRVTKDQLNNLSNDAYEEGKRAGERLAYFMMQSDRTGRNVHALDSNAKRVVVAMRTWQTARRAVDRGFEPDKDPCYEELCAWVSAVEMMHND